MLAADLLGSRITKESATAPSNHEGLHGQKTTLDIMLWRSQTENGIF